MRARFLKEVATLGLPVGPGPLEIVTDADLSALPDPAQRYLSFMGVVGRPRDWAFRLAFTGRFRTRPGQAWMPCQTWQYNTCLAIARVFQIRLRFGGLVPVVGRDSYLGGRGRMLIRFLDVWTIRDAAGPEYDLGELVTYLNDAVLIAPSMLLNRDVTWTYVNGESFDVSLADHDRIVTGRVVIDQRGAPHAFSTSDRFCDDPNDPKRPMRVRWTTPVAGWQTIAGRQLPTHGEATWHFPQGPFTYAELSAVPGTVAFNVPPGR